MNSELKAGYSEMKKSRWCFLLTPVWLVILAVVTGCIQAQEPLIPNSSRSIHYSTPPGITLVEVSRKISRLNIYWVGLGNAEGRTLFISDADVTPGKSNCEGDCAKEFPPVIADADATPVGEWSLVVRGNGDRQWAYKGKPLYRFARETRFNEVVDNIIASQKKSALEARVPDISGVNRDLTLPEGWQIARFEPEKSIDTPVAVMVREIPAASSHALVDELGMTLYVRSQASATRAPECEADCAFRYQPVVASELSNPLGQFAPVTHQDGTRQWAYDNALLYTYTGDLVPGDIHGLKGQDGWQVVTVAQHFTPPSVSVQQDLAYGNILSTVDGMPLYSRYTIERGLDKRTEDDDTYIKGKGLGVKGCNAECLQTWRPLIAPAGAQSQGFWEVYEHADGTRQWAYKGFAQFTNVNDRPSAGVSQNNQVVYIIGDKGPYKLEDSVTDSIFAKGFQWRVSDLNAR